jgi:V/A-type H+-transporting ATPase subunit C
MKSRLLSRKELDTMIGSGSLQGLIAALTKTIYHKSIESALTRTIGMDCIAESLHNELVNTLGKIRTFYIGQSGDMVALVLRAYDIHNIKTILRGLSRNVPTGEILAASLPVGEVSYHILVELANVRDLRTVIDVIATLRLPFAQPLLNLRAGRVTLEPFEMELALDQWYLQESLRYLKSQARGRNLLADAINMDSDLANLLTVLRFAHSPAERGFLRERIASDDLSRLFLGPGHLSFALLAHAGAQDSLESAIATFAGTAYEAPLKAGLEAYVRSGRLSSIEKSLKRYRLEWMIDLIPKDPLGIGVVLGYVALKINEVNNIRWIAQGINIGLKAESIRMEVEYVQ